MNANFRNPLRGSYRIIRILERLNSDVQFDPIELIIALQTYAQSVKLDLIRNVVESNAMFDHLPPQIKDEIEKRFTAFANDQFGAPVAERLKDPKELEESIDRITAAGVRSMLRARENAEIRFKIDTLLRKFK